MSSCRRACAHPALRLTGTTCANGLGMEPRTSCLKVVSKSPRVTRVSELQTAGTPPWDHVRSCLARGQVLARWGSQSVQQESPHSSPVRATAKADTTQRAGAFLNAKATSDGSSRSQGDALQQSPPPSAAEPQHWRPVCVWDRRVLSCPEAMPPRSAQQASWSQCQLHLHLPSHTYPQLSRKGVGGGVLRRQGRSVAR